jgi:hypothetical protein
MARLLGNTALEQKPWWMRALIWICGVEDWIHIRDCQEKHRLELEAAEALRMQQMAEFMENNHVRI